MIISDISEQENMVNLFCSCNGKNFRFEFNPEKMKPPEVTSSVNTNTNKNRQKL